MDTLLAQSLFGGAAALDLGDELSRGLYEDGIPPDTPAAIGAAARKSGLNAERLLEAWHQGPAATATAMAQIRSAGVEIYPSLYLRTGEALTVINEGFASADELLPIIQQSLGELA